MISISCIGRVRVMDAQGADITPRSERACAIIILLALSPGGERRRAWLQDKLWSDRCFERASQSLRQALSDIRSAFGPSAGVLQADRRRVRLQDFEIEDPETIDLEELFDVYDKEFEAWIRETAAARIEPNPRPRAPEGESSNPALSGVTIAVQADGASRMDADFLRGLLIDRIFQSIDEYVPVHRVDGAVVDADFTLDIETELFDETCAFRVTWRQGKQGHSLWSNSRLLEVGTDHGSRHDQVLNFSSAACAGFLETRRNSALRQGKSDLPDVLALEGLHRMFTLDRAMFPKAEKFLRSAYKATPRASYLAWLAMLNNMKVIERYDVDLQSASEEAQALARQALELDPSNTTVQAIASNTLFLNSGRLDLAHDLAKSAITNNPANPMAWDALSLISIHVGKKNRAHTYALKAQKLGGAGFLKPWLDMACCLTSVNRQDVSAAIDFAKKSHILLPHFRPPLRYLTVLNASQGRLQEATKYRDKLAQLEHDFSVIRMLEDESYPLASLRSSGVPMEMLRQIA